MENIPLISKCGGLSSDAKRIADNMDCRIVGMQSIKARRLEEIEVDCHVGTMVGEYVPFYFCPRSIMLYIFYMGNHPDLTYRDGQGPIVHLQADLLATVQWANQNKIKWAFSDRNAGSFLASFYADLSNLIDIDWSAIQATDFSTMNVKEGKQAEFLVYESFPWALVEKIGVIDLNTAQDVQNKLQGAAHRPPVIVERAWYY